ncbi:MAG: SDR family oxidoreductase [Gemmataceae bacterium]|nr:SDR family oxidoreductase [Gemmataceae bacterium]
MHLAGKIGVVVGAARGIGRAIAYGFAAEGATAVLIDRDDAVDQTASELAIECGTIARAYRADVARFDDMTAVAAEVRKDFGRLDHLVFAVGIGSGKFGFPFWNIAPSDWPRVMEVNVLGAVHTLHAFAPLLLERKEGSVLLVASVAGQMGSQTDPPYSASKAALINFGQCAAKDLAPHGVRVNMLCPGMVKTELNRSIWEAWARQQPADQRKTYEEWTDEKIRRVTPMGRWQEAEEMAAMAVYLASPHGRNICGQCLNVDGGFVMH